MTFSVDTATLALLRERAARYGAAALFARDQALSSASHDLRGPLNAMQSWAYVLERQLPAADAALQRALAGIRTAIEQQTQLVCATLDAPRADARQLPLECERCDARALIEACVPLAHIALGQARASTITTDIAAGDGATVYADRGWLAQALWTMTVFALDAATPGTTVMLACDTRASADCLSFEVAFVADPAALVEPGLPHLFDAATRREALQARDGKRPPWTLALCHRVALAHGGTFTAPALDAAVPARMTLTLPRVANP